MRYPFLDLLAAPWNRDKLFAFWSQCHGVGCRLLSLISLGISLKYGITVDFPAKHSLDRPSATTLRFLHYLASIPGSEPIRAGW